jgi:hypothetical protein
MMLSWSSFGAGMLAYGVMSNLASRNHYHSYNNYNRNGMLLIYRFKKKFFDHDLFSLFFLKDMVPVVVVVVVAAVRA